MDANEFDTLLQPPSGTPPSGQGRLGRRGSNAGLSSVSPGLSLLAALLFLSIFAFTLATLIQTNTQSPATSSQIQDLGHSLREELRPLISDLVQSTSQQNLQASQTAATQKRISSSALPWENVLPNNRRAFQFVTFNYDTTSFDPQVVQEAAATIDSFILDAAWPSWRQSSSIDTSFVVPLTVYGGDTTGLSTNLPLTTSSTPIQYKIGQYIPILLVPTFHQLVQATDKPSYRAVFANSVISGSAPQFYANTTGSPSTAFTNLWTELYNVPHFPPGTPFIIIAADQLNAMFNSGQENPLLPGNAPQDLPFNRSNLFNLGFALQLAKEVISTLVDPAKANYMNTGDTIGGNREFFALKMDAIEPVSVGWTNVVPYNSWLMPNFVYPTYFHAYDNAGVYDYNRRVISPMHPHSGIQYLFYQRGQNDPVAVDTDMLIAAYISPASNPSHTELMLGGSIYQYASWGFDDSAGSTWDTLVLKSQPPLTTPLRHWTNLDYAANGPVPTFSQRQIYLALGPNHPLGMLSYNFVDPVDNIPYANFAMINYVESQVSMTDLNAVITTMNQDAAQSFALDWGWKGKITGFSSASQPDWSSQTWTAMLILPAGSLNTNLSGWSCYTGGSCNENNVPNHLAGPTIDNWMYNPPPLPLGCPFVTLDDNEWGGPTSGTSSSAIANIISGVYAHEMQELLMDPWYAKYVVFTNPPEDQILILGQLEVSDPVEVEDEIVSIPNYPVVPMNAYVLPNYFMPALQSSNEMDIGGFVNNAMLPYERQQTIHQWPGQAVRQSWVFNFPLLLLSVLEACPPGVCFNPSVASYFQPGVFEKSYWLVDLGVSTFFDQNWLGYELYQGARWPDIILGIFVASNPSALGDPTITNTGSFQRMLKRQSYIYYSEADDV